MTQCLTPIVSLRCLPLPRRQLHPEARHRLLHDPAVPAERPHRHTVLGGVLDQHRRHPGSGDNRPPDGPHHDDSERRGPDVATPSVVHQGHRRVDVCVSAVRVRLAARVCHGERLL